jgi:hypothetical protein
MARSVFAHLLNRRDAFRKMAVRVIKLHEGSAIETLREDDVANPFGIFGRAVTDRIKSAYAECG